MYGSIADRAQAPHELWAPVILWAWSRLRALQVHIVPHWRLYVHAQISVRRKFRRRNMCLFTPMLVQSSSLWR